MYQDTLRLLDCPRAPAVTVRETPRVAVTGRASIGTCSRVAGGSLAPKNTPYNLSNDCGGGRGLQGTSQSHRSIGAPIMKLVMVVAVW